VKYFRNTELAKIYNVSEKSVRNWVQAARDEKLSLELHEKDGKFWVANTRENVALLETQAKKGKKYKNTRALKVVTPTDDFYEAYTLRQILDIISNLTIHHEIPIQYSYANGAAQYWDEYAKRLDKEQSPNILNKTIEMLDVLEPSIDDLTNSKTRKVNIVDLGPGNGLPVKDFLKKLHEKNRLARYIAIDTSQAMLDIVGQNINEWFNGEVKFDGHVIDFSHERFDHVFVEDSTNDEDMPLNIVCLLGGTLSNLKSPSQGLQTINQSLRFDDLLIYTAYLDTPNTRRYFDFNTSQPHQKLRTELILEKLGIKEENYQIELGFDEAIKARYIRFVPNTDIRIEFKLDGGTRNVSLAKGVPVLLGRHWHKSALDMINLFDDMGFDLLSATKSYDQQYLLTLSGLRTTSQTSK
jgi:transposase